MDYRQRRGTSHSPSEYHARFPHETAAVDEAFECSRQDQLPATIGKYQIIDQLDAGGQALIYRVVHPTLKKELVLKIARDPISMAQGEKDRLVTEGQLLAELEHPNTARVYDLDFHDGRPFLVMEYIRGRNLRQYVQHTQTSPADAAKLVGKIARALHVAHMRGIVHQDIKPENIVIDEIGEPCVIDFGLARLRHAWKADLDEQGGLSGTVQFMAPEQARAKTNSVDPRSDFFALGALLYWLLSGKAPFAGNDFRDSLIRARECNFDRDALRGISHRLSAICLKAMAADPAQRYATANGLAEALERFTTSGQTVTVLRGHLNDGVMELDEAAMPATVYLTSPEKDLALIKLNQLPLDDVPLPVISLADQLATPGASCVAIGHPRAGLLWTVRSGEVAGVGVWPGDMIETVMTRLSMTGAEQDQLTKLLQASPQRKVLVSTCGINPGDSGGPLLNEKGELIAVTFAIPKGGAEEGISLDKFSYHVHLDEIKQFIDRYPDVPAMFVADAWPLAMYSMLMDSDNDQRADVWMFGAQPEQPPTGLLYDLDQDTSEQFLVEYEINPEANGLWDSEFAVQQYPLARTFYDTDNDGQLDLILTDVDDDYVADIVLTRNRDHWVKASDTDRPMFDAAAFDNRTMQERFVRLLQSEPQPLAVSGEAQPANATTPQPIKGTGKNLNWGYMFSVVVCLIVAGFTAVLWFRRPRRPLPADPATTVFVEPDAKRNTPSHREQAETTAGGGSQITKCRNCNTRVAAKQDGTCPACGSVC